MTLNMFTEKLIILISNAQLLQMILSTMVVVGRETSTLSIFHLLTKKVKLLLITQAQILLLLTTSLLPSLILLIGFLERMVKTTKKLTSMIIFRIVFTPTTLPLRDHTL
jgi:hypothetical protein